MWWLTTTATAATLVGGLSADGSVESPSRHLGAGAMIGAALDPAWSLEATAEGRLSWEDAARIASRAEIRWAFPGASALAGGGAAWIPGDGLAPQLSAGLAVDTGQGWRTQARYLYTLQQQPAVLLSIGRVWPSPPAVVEAPPPEPEPEPEPKPEAVDLASRLADPDDVQIWVPHPVCEWIPAAEAEAFLATLSPDQIVQLRAAGFLPQTARLGDTDPIDMQPVPAQGSLVIAAGPGDQVSIAHEASAAPVPISLNDDGNGVVTMPEGDFTVSVSGAGRQETHSGVITDGYAVWYAIKLPDEVVVRFANNSSQLSPAARQEIARILAAPGSWVYQIWGSASPEGSQERNRQLAMERAQAVADALIAGGLPPSQVSVLPPSAQHPAGSAATQRAAHIIPARGAP